ncbi:MAG: nitrile hydratase subunit alpha [Rhizobiaceae bacterium]|nr:nitrile hydratase subunit alpha [Rhizobiaceae bacterium]
MHDDHNHGQGGHEYGPEHHPVQADAPSVEPQIALMEQALRELLLKKGIFTTGELHRSIERMEALDGAILGKKVVARAWNDPEYRSLLLDDGPRAIAEFGASLGLPEFRVVENAPTIHNVIVCTLCSCYPRGLLGLPPSWYKSKEYRSRVVREPRSVLEEFGLALPPEVEIRVHDSTADLRFMVLPMRPVEAAHLDEEALAEIVTRDSLIGVGLPLGSQ